MRWHKDDFARAKGQCPCGNRDFGLAFQNVGEGIERGGMLTQSLSFIECENRNCPRGAMEKRSADHRPFLVADFCLSGCFSTPQQIGVVLGGLAHISRPAETTG